MAKLRFITAFNIYHEINLLGEGGSGRVYKVKNGDGELFAIKCLSARAPTQKQKRFKNEIAFCERNKHKNIVTVLDYGTGEIDGENCPFYVMPLYSSTLRGLMKTGIPLDKRLPYLGQILDGLEAAHLQNIWHRDLKPENILYDANADVLAIADFGIAHFNEENLLTLVETKPNERLANFQYAAPEQRTTGKTGDQRADIYALGLIANEMFTGIVLQGTGYRKIADITSEYPYLDEIIDKMVQQQAEQRFSSIKEIKQVLLARGNEWVSFQKLSQLKQTIVPESDIDDPLVAYPVALEDLKIGDELLTLVLSQSVTREWGDIFATRETHSSRDGLILPQFFDIHDNFASIEMKRIGELNEQSIQHAVDEFKKYLANTNNVYRDFVIERQRQWDEAERRKLEAKIKDEETRRKILKNVKI